MASTYSTNLRLELIGTGEQQGTWGITTNTNLGTLLEQAIGGYTSVTVTDGADTTLTVSNGSSDQSRCMTINLTGTLTAARNVICPAIQKVYIVKNATSGGFAVTFKVSGQTGVSIPSGGVYLLYVDGTDVRQVNGSIAAQNSNNVTITGGSITGITDLAIADGGTGASTASAARTNLGLGTIATQNANAVAITGGTINATAITGGSVSGITALAVADGGTGASTAANARTNLGLGTAATLNVGTSANNIVQLDSTAKLPAVDGSQLTNISGGTGRLLRAPQVLTSGTSYTTPANCNAIYVECVGGGGGGGGATDSGSDGSGGGGGSGAYAAKYFTVSPTTAYTIAIGAGGTVSSGASGSSGGSTTFTVSAVTVTAGGGGGGTGGAGSNRGGSGGTATGGDINISGSAGGTSSCVLGNPIGGAGASSFFGGAGQAGDNTNGSAGSSGGGGGGGATSTATNRSGGAGGAGIIRVWEYA